MFTFNTQSMVTSKNVSQGHASRAKIVQAFSLSFSTYVFNCYIPVYIYFYYLFNKIIYIYTQCKMKCETNKPKKLKIIIKKRKFRQLSARAIAYGIKNYGTEGGGLVSRLGRLFFHLRV